MSSRFLRPLLLILCAATPAILSSATDGVRGTLADLQHRQTTAENQWERLRADQETATTLTRRFTPQKIQALLAVPDQSALLDAIASVATSLAISSPKIAFGAETPFTEIPDTGLSRSTVTISGKAPDDLAVRGLAEHVQRLLQGRVRLAEVSLQRETPAGALSVSNIAFTLRFDWVSNASEKRIP